MTIRKKCSCCDKPITTKNAKNIGRNELGLWLNCPCGTTILLIKGGLNATNNNGK